MASIIDRLRSYLESELSSDDDYEVDEYVLERREPDPEARVRTYDEPVSAQPITTEEELPSGTYLLQEIKPSGMAGEVVWTEELDFEDG
jgi:hypothetical protein